MSTGFELAATIREDLGKGATRRLRKQDMVPAVIYGAGSDPVSITLSHNQLLHSTENEAFFSHILSIDVAGKKENVIIKALQRHPAKAILMHADFLRVSMKEKLKVNVPIHFIGEDVAPGVKEGGVVTHNLVDIEIECLPKNLPEFVEVDISELGIGDSLHLSDIKLSKGLDIVALHQGEDHDLQIVTIQMNRAALVDEEESEEETEAGDDSASEEESGE
ncbi:MAG TPA: 50S ribosomal protein L25/general stress protein Ctc [Cycloclasticus sp.]|jgi:large subunit ribosomal protein L25|nr:50S ribosomal protein L25/general stress protein Ctc [Cycloclasticus sp.]HIL92777.1 50S ribosomal protein L25/general stress protein Ctc [Cycloclasticus sp.]